MNNLAKNLMIGKIFIVFRSIPLLGALLPIGHSWETNISLSTVAVASGGSGSQKGSAIHLQFCLLSGKISGISAIYFSTT